MKYAQQDAEPQNKKNVGTCNNSFSLQKLPAQESVHLFDSFWNSVHLRTVCTTVGASAQRQLHGCRDEQ
jgi:hypothetical protein